MLAVSTDCAGAEHTTLVALLKIFVLMQALCQ
jgi:hypothetical protein